MSDLLAGLEPEYAEALGAHLERPGEEALQRAYRLGRRALDGGVGLLEWTSMHHRSVERALGRRPPGADLSAARRAADAFFIESLTPFEMAHQALREATVALRRMGQRVEDEAKRVAHALHDEAGTLLGSVHLALEEVAGSLPRRKRAGLVKVRTLLDQIEQELRRLSHELRPTLLDDLGLLPALDFLTKGVAKRTGMGIVVKEEGAQTGRLPAEVETTLYRNVQEALNNVARHARARRVTVTLKRSDDCVRCSVRDDGAGFAPRAVAHGDQERGLGLPGMRERLDAVGGSLEVASSPGHGTEIKMSVPIEV